MSTVEVSYNRSTALLHINTASCIYRVICMKLTGALNITDIDSILTSRYKGAQHSSFLQLDNIFSESIYFVVWSTNIILRYTLCCLSTTFAVVSLALQLLYLCGLPAHRRTLFLHPSFGITRPSTFVSFGPRRIYFIAHLLQICYFLYQYIIRIPQQRVVTATSVPDSIRSVTLMLLTAIGSRLAAAAVSAAESAAAETWSNTTRRGDDKETRWSGNHPELLQILTPLPCKPHRVADCRWR